MTSVDQVLPDASWQPTFGGSRGRFFTRELPNLLAYREWLISLIRAIPPEWRAGPCTEVVRAKDAAGYAFARRLREMVRWDNAAILQVCPGLSHEDEGLYFTEPDWDSGPDDPEGRVTLAFYQVDHSRRV